MTTHEQMTAASDTLNRSEKNQMTDIEKYLETKEFQNKMPVEVKDIMERYNLSSREGIERALSQAMWVGICLGKGWK